MDEKHVLHKMNNSLRTFQQDMLALQKLKGERHKKITLTNEQFQKRMQKPEQEAEQVKQEIFQFIEENRPVFEKIRSIKSNYGIFGLFKCPGRVNIKGDESEVVKRLQKSKIRGRSKYVRVRKEINKAALLEDYRRGKIKQEDVKQLLDLDIEIVAGDIPFVRPNLPNTPSIDEQAQKFEEAA